MVREETEGTSRCYNVSRFLPRMADELPDHPAVRAPTGRDRYGNILYDERSFRELNALADACAHTLGEKGLRRGSRVLLMVRPGLDLILLCFALFKTGAVPIVIDPGMGIRSFLACVRRTRPEILIGIPAAIAFSRLFLRSFTGLEKRILVRPRGAFLRRLETRVASRPESFPVAETGADEAAAILFTSGSTGPPKGVCYAHGMFEAQVDSIRNQYRIEPGEVDLPMLPIFALFNPALGMTTVVPEMNPGRPARANPKKIVAAIRQNAVTNSFGSPVLWWKIAHYCLAREIRLPSLRRVLIAGAPVSPELVRRLGEVVVNGEIHTPYGATEALPVSSHSGREIVEETWQRTERGMGTCLGHPLPGIDAAMIPIRDSVVAEWDPESKLPPECVGEICVKGKVVTREYDRLPEATARAKIPDARDGGLWHRMGDLGYQDADGRLWFCGRMVERVEPGEGRILYTDCCEEVFNCHPKVRRSALVGLGRAGCHVPVIVIEPHRGHFPYTGRARRAFEKEILDWAEKREAIRDIRRVVFRRRFPVDVRHNAKIHRLSLKRWLEARTGLTPPA